MHDDDPMAVALAELGGIVLADQPPLERILARVAELANQLISGADEASVTLIDGSDAVSAASTGGLALALDERQYEAGHGPCLDAARTGAEFHVPDLRTESRWPGYTPRALAIGALSSLSIPLPFQSTPIGSLNIYAKRANAFAETDVELARAFAGYAAIALQNARVFAASAMLAEQMRTAMQSRAVIEQAKGILMGERRIGPDEAFEILRALSQASNRKVRDVAQAVVDMALPDTTQR